MLNEDKQALVEAICNTLENNLDAQRLVGNCESFFVYDKNNNNYKLEILWLGLAVKIEPYSCSMGPGVTVWLWECELISKLVKLIRTRTNQIKLANKRASVVSITNQFKGK